MFLIILICVLLLSCFFFFFIFLLFIIFCLIFFFFVSIMLYVYIGTFNIYYINMYYSFSIEYQLIGWLFLFLAFAVKVPVYLFHIWLPEAHVEAPTVVSILLAGILLILGSYGIIKFSNLLFPFGLYYYRPLVILLCLLGIYYTSLIAI